MKFDSTKICYSRLKYLMKFKKFLKTRYYSKSKCSIEIYTITLFVLKLGNKRKHMTLYHIYCNSKQNKNTLMDMN